MTADANYSLLLMRDDGRIYRWRIGLRLFRVLCCIGLLLPLLLGGLGWLAWRLYQDNAPLNAQVLRLEDENRTLGATIRRLANLEQLLDLSENAKLSALQSQQAKLKAAAQPPPLEVPPQENPKDQTQDAILLDASQMPQTPPPPAVDLKCVGIENLQIRRQGNTIRVALDLHNILQKSQIGGQVACILKGSAGESFLLEIPKDVSTFRISRFKRIGFATPLPATARNLAAPTLVLEISLEERGIVYRNEYPVEQ
jgi:hypothetical protein